MARWVPFLGLAGLVLTALLALARLSQGVVRDPPELPPGDDDEATPAPTGTVDGPPVSDPKPAIRPRDGAASAGLDRADAATVGTASEGARREPGPARERGRRLTTRALLANVALTQGLFGGIVAAGAVFYGIPGEALGITADPWVGGAPALCVGIAFGLLLWGANEAGASLADAVGASYDEGLREMLAPESTVGWVVLLALVLPVIAGVEELLFRAVLVGVPAAGFDVSPWALAVVSSVAFALGHGAQGRVGIAVTGALGFVLAAGFVLSGSLLAVVVAHYLVNALEFLVHEGLGYDRLLA